MSQITLKGNPIHTIAEMPAIGTKAPAFYLVSKELKDIALDSFLGKKIVLNIFPSIDTPVCATSVRKFNAEASKFTNTVILCISADLPFAQARFCGAEGLDNVMTLSTFRSDFADDYGLKIVDGPLAGLLARAVIVLDEEGNVIYNELVPEIAQEPAYENALNSLK